MTIIYHNFPHILVKTGRSISTSIFNMILPQNCSLCGIFVNNAGLCANCWGQLKLLSSPFCTACGRPLIHELADSLCASCHQKPFIMSPLRAICAYNPAVAKLILPFKHGGRLDFTPLITRLMTPFFKELIQQADFVIPVPLHRRRYFSRRYNQAAELARHLCISQNIRDHFKPNLLYRTKYTRSMGYLNARARNRNVAGAFSLHKDAKQHLQGKRILLIDDVMTTGATLEACARLLIRKGGASQVSALVFARVLQDS